VAAELRSVAEARGADQYLAGQRLRAARGLPRYVVLADFDNELVLDLDNVLSIEMLGHLVKQHDRARLVEVFPAPDELAVRGPEGDFLCELFVPFTWSAAPAPPAAAAQAVPNQLRRRFAPGAEWLYAKIYTGPALADRVLTEAIAPVVAEPVVEDWFFHRYPEPEPHLRVRFRGDPARLTTEVLPLLAARLAPFVDDGQVARWQLDTYVREVERYGGGEGMLLAERVFGVDAACVLDILPSVSGDEGASWRWKVALCGVDLLLDAFGLTLADKAAWVRARRDAFASEFQVDSRVRRQLGDKHRAERDSIEALLRLAHGAEAEQYPPLVALRDRSIALTPIVRELRLLERSGRLTESRANLLASFAHLHVNRMLRSSQRHQELVLYELLERTYRSQLARGAAA
jgi:thiopeptide-type bacteriocin biosynthesis protein